MQMKSDFSNSCLTWLITGVAEFIGEHMRLRLFAKSDYVIGFDALNDYRDVSLKLRPFRLQLYQNYSFPLRRIMNCERVAKLFESVKRQCVIHLAAQAEVRCFLVDLQAYVGSNRDSRV